jgi:hypothetical protein
MTAFSPIPDAPALTTSNLQSSTVLYADAGDAINGNSTPYEIGTMTIANDGSGPGDVTLWSSDITDANFKDQFITVPQTFAIAAPEPGTLIFLGAGLGGLAAFVRARRQRV